MAWATGSKTRAPSPRSPPGCRGNPPGCAWRIRQGVAGAKGDGTGGQGGFGGVVHEGGEEMTEMGRVEGDGGQVVRDVQPQVDAGFPSGDQPRLLIGQYHRQGTTARTGRLAPGEHAQL